MSCVCVYGGHVVVVVGGQSVDMWMGGGGGDVKWLNKEGGGELGGKMEM